MVPRIDPLQTTTPPRTAPAGRVRIADRRHGEWLAGVWDAYGLRDFEPSLRSPWRERAAIDRSHDRPALDTLQARQAA
ncbi:hypothetical protein Thimo_3538 [Thioflavicoccus mobilis 8321]|uniref:Uncharacterized protein n=1 Tax=Thioflavicoccus mobilis 8321 TaxID=765912 RepID=L0H3F4_9GAMM|nr:hypothetical protein Thimo_3538 [Thioflavicoccus mobilis 8321]